MSNKTKTFEQLVTLVETADFNNPDKAERNTAEAELRELGIVDTDGQWILPNNNPHVAKLAKHFS